jgi:hypothetical protein
VAKKAYYGPVYFRRESEPYMTLSVAGTRLDAGVSVAEVNLKLIWEVVSQIKVGQHGQAYVIDAGGRLIAHPGESTARTASARASSTGGGRGDDSLDAPAPKFRILKNHRAEKCITQASWRNVPHLLAGYDVNHAGYRWELIH